MECSVSWQEAKFVEEHLRVIVHDGHDSECITVQLILGKPKALLYHLFDAVFRKPIVEKHTTVHDFVSASFCLHALARLRSSVHGEEISNHLFVIFNHICPNHIFFGKHKVGDVILREFVIHFALFHLLLVKLKDCGDVFLFHQPYDTINLYSRLIRQFVLVHKLLHGHVCRLMSVLNLR